MILYFIFYHIDGLDFENLKLIKGYILPCTFVTLVARKFGITASILTHIMINCVVITLQASFMNEVGHADIKYYYFFFVLSVLLIILQYVVIDRLQKGKPIWFLSKD